MQRGSFLLLLNVLANFAVFALFISSCNGGELSEIQSFFNFIRALDPKNVLGIEKNQSPPYHPCSNHHWIGVECSKLHLRALSSITEIRLPNLNLSGILDAESLCRLPNLRVLILANNRIQGTVPECIMNCSKLMHLDLSGNLLRGSPHAALTRIKNLRRLDISNNHFGSPEIGFAGKNSILSNASRAKTIHRKVEDITATATEAVAPALETVSNGTKNSGKKSYPKHEIIWILVAMGVVFLLVLAFFMKLKDVQAAKDRDTTREIGFSHRQSPSAKYVKEVNVDERRSELIFFVKEQERFGLEELLDATANLRNQGLCSSLYKVQLKNNAIFAVKRLKKLKVSFEEFGQLMRKVGNLKHPNILSLVGYHSSDENKLVVYRYQKNGSLLSLFENYIEGKRDFPWKLRLSIAVGIARGLNFIYQRQPDDGEIIPHGNIKPSNILLNENLEPLISEYGFSKLLKTTKEACLLNSTSHMAPEKRLTELADVYSFGVILLELLTGKIAENQENGSNLPKWVKAKVREEWTGEVFDKEIANVEMYGFPLLNIALKCVSKLPPDRPSISEVLEKIEQVVNAQQDISPSSSNSYESS